MGAPRASGPPGKCRSLPVDRAGDAYQLERHRPVGLNRPKDGAPEPSAVRLHLAHEAWENVTDDPAGILYGAIPTSLAAGALKRDQDFWSGSDGTHCSLAA